MRAYQFGLATFVATALLLTACSDGATVTVSQPQQSGISVTGNGSVTVVPDIAVLSLGVEVTAKTVADARMQAAEAMAAVQQTLTDNAIADADITTTSFSIQPQYDYRSDDTPQVIGYTVSNRLSVKVRNIDSVSDVLDDATGAGGDDVRINGISFTVDEPEQFQDEVRKLAIEDARERAEQLASLAGVTLGKARTISESSSSSPFADSGGGRVFAAAAQAETSISPGETEISISVFVTYGIE
jgi:uncharacterized protein YggE